MICCVFIYLCRGNEIATFHAIAISPLILGALFHELPHVTEPLAISVTLLTWKVEVGRDLKESLTTS